MNFLTEHGIGSYEELVERCDAVAAVSIRTREILRDTEQRIADLSLLGKQIDTYRKLKPVYDRYKASKGKEKFLRGFESEIILFEAAAREIKKAGLTKLPSAEKIKAELNELTTRKTALQVELWKIQREEKEYDALRRNVSSLLKQPAKKEKAQEMELSSEKFPYTSSQYRKFSNEILENAFDIPKETPYKCCIRPLPLPLIIFTFKCDIQRKPFMTNLLLPFERERRHRTL